MKTWVSARLVFIALSCKEDTIVMKFPEQLHVQNGDKASSILSYAHAASKF